MEKIPEDTIVEWGKAVEGAHGQALLYRTIHAEPSREELKRLAEIRAKEGKKTFDNFILYDMQMQIYDGTYWLIGSMQTAASWFEENGTLLLVIKSKSGKPEGPARQHVLDPGSFCR